MDFDKTNVANAKERVESSHGRERKYQSEGKREETALLFNFSWGFVFEPRFTCHLEKLS
jgi:hypothetical protein